MEQDALTPLHPAYLTITRIGWGFGVMPLLLIALVADIRSVLPPGMVIVPVLLLAIYMVLRLPVRRYRARGYDLAPDRLRVARGVLFRSDTVVPFGRVQHIDVHQGPLERAYGLGTLILHTAGNHNASVALPGLPHEEAVAIRERIRHHIRREAL